MKPNYVYLYPQGQIAPPMYQTQGNVMYSTQQQRQTSHSGQTLDNTPYLVSSHHSHIIPNQVSNLPLGFPDQGMRYQSFQSRNEALTEHTQHSLSQGQVYHNIQTAQPIIIEKVHKQQFIVEKPVITREIVYQSQVQPVFVQKVPNSLPGSPSRLKRSRSLTSESVVLQNTPIQESPKMANFDGSAIMSPQDEKIAALEKQIATYRSELEKTFKENQEMKKMIAKYEYLINDYESRLRSTSEGQNACVQELERYKTVVANYEAQFAFFQKDLEKYKSALTKSQEEVQTLQSEATKIEELKADLTKISGYLSSKIKETEDCKLRLSEKDAIFSGIESKMQILLDEVERLNILLKQKVEEVNFLNVKITETQTFSRQSFEQSEILSREIDRLNGIIRENNAELETWRLKYTEYSGLTLQIQDLMAKLVLLSCEVEALRMRVAGSEKEVQEMRRSNILKTLNEGVIYWWGKWVWLISSVFQKIEKSKLNEDPKKI